MSTPEKTSVLSREEIQSRVIAVLEDMTADWELDSTEGIEPETRLMEDLAFESIDVVQLVVAIEKEFNRKGLPFERLFMHEGDYVDEILVKEVVDFLMENLK
ncbi:MAG TPA: phosphopantetheine-binding protein [Chroococcales cyanobacterium]|jgi:acyl carrier protein